MRELWAKRRQRKGMESGLDFLFILVVVTLMENLSYNSREDLTKNIQNVEE